MKRKSIALLLALSMCLSLLSACGSGNTATDDKPSESENAASSTEQPEESEKPEESTEQPEESAEPTQEPEQEQTEESTEPEPAVPAEMTYTFDAATGTLTCSGGGEVTQEDWVEVVKNTLFETDYNKATAEVKKAVVERGVTSLGKGAFYRCENLVEITLPDTLTSIGGRAFIGDPLTSIAIPESVTEIGYQAFQQCQTLSNVNLPGGLTEISDQLFNGCTNLTSIEIPKGVTRIGETAFMRTGLTELTIPEGVTAIESGFIAATPITSITLPASLTEWDIGFYNNDDLTDITFLCEATMDNVQSLVGYVLEEGTYYNHPITVHASAGSVIEGYINRQLQNGMTGVTFVPID